jgi:hypothetical protein
LHVLGTPPAFILSQDQTLRKFTLSLGPKVFASLTYHSSVVKVLFPYGRRSISRPSPLVKSGIHCCWRLSPADHLPRSVQLPRLSRRNRRRFYHTPLQLSNPGSTVTVRFRSPMVPRFVKVLGLSRRNEGGFYHTLLRQSNPGSTVACCSCSPATCPDLPRSSAFRRQRGGILSHPYILVKCESVCDRATKRPADPCCNLLVDDLLNPPHRLHIA